MSLTRAQLIAGDSGQGPVLPGQVQGVKEGSGVSIANDGTISFDAETSQGVVKTNNPSAFNGYVWPNAKSNSAFLLTSGVGDNLEWVFRGFGISLDGIATKSIKQAVPFGNFIEPGVTEAESIPPIGGGTGQAALGSLYWNTSSEQLFICTSTSGSGTWSEASYGPLDLSEELLTGSYTLYVNPETGEDTFVTGVRVSGVRKQEVTAGYSPQKPFRTIARAAIEVARLQNGFGNDSQFFDRYIIKCSAGVHYVDNSIGSSVSAWVDEFIPQDIDLRKLNSSSRSGIILPRGVSVIGEDLRKTVIRPAFVPNKTGNHQTDRGSIFRITGAGFFFNFTFKDKEGYLESHHLLDCFSFVSDADLEGYYDKVRTVFAQPAANDSVEPGETEIVAPKPPGTATVDTDGVMGSSPYIFNCSVRSAYGLCGVFADGSQVTGFKSMVTAQFTGVSLQRDPYCWQKYNPFTKQWEALSGLFYDEYILLSPNDLRMNPNRRSFHIKAINEAFIQEVSVFAIGQGVHHWSESGGELSITNSNSSFGGCAAIAEGYKGEAFPQDTNWNIANLNLATNLSDQTPVVRSFSLGTISLPTQNDSLVITLESPLEDSDTYPGVPNILAELNYSLKEDSYLWIENPEGPDWRAPLASVAWDSSSPDEIVVKSVFENQDGQTPGGARSGGFWPNLQGSRVYVRRLYDSRSVEKRRYSLDCTNTDSNTRTPLRDYVIQTSVGGGAGIVGLLPDTNLTFVNKSGPIPIGGDPVVRKVRVILQRGNPSITWAPGPNNFYRPGDIVKYQNKHFTCLVQNSDGAFDPNKWNESYVHMPSDYNAYDYPGNLAPPVVFDNDTDGATPTQTCGYNLTTCWTLDPSIRNQYRTATDYRGVYQFLRGIGFSDPDATSILAPQPASQRVKNTSSSTDMLGFVPSGAANSLSNWAVEFRRPSVVRMFGHAWEWAGYLNYTKALPSYQKELSPQNQFTYYFTNSLGGKVYATGYNQEGYQITPSGITDLGTGATVPISSIGSPATGVDASISFDYLTVGALTVTESLSLSGNVEGSPTFSPEFYTNLFTEGQGIIRTGNTLSKSFNTPYTPPLNLTYDTGGTVVLDEGVYYCNNLTIAAGTTVTSSRMNLVFYCTGNVSIQGNINVDGKGEVGGGAEAFGTGDQQLLGGPVGHGPGGSGSYPSRGSSFLANRINGGLPSMPFHTYGSGGSAGYLAILQNGNGINLPGGAGGGGVAIRARGAISIGSLAVVSANGHPGFSVSDLVAIGWAWSGNIGLSGSGGGSGGAIILHSDTSITNLGTLRANGGSGSNAYIAGTATGANGGCGGGGGLIVLQSPTTTNSGTTQLNGGALGLTAGVSGAQGSGAGGSNGGKGGGTTVLKVQEAGGDGILLTKGSPFD